MKLTNWRVENYKSIEEGEFEASDLTVLIGKNNSGKSNVVDSLDDFRFAWDGVGRKNHSWFEQIVTGKDDSRTVRLQFEFEFSDAERETVLDELTGQKLEQAQQNGWLSNVFVQMEVKTGPSRDYNISTNWEGETVSVGSLQRENDTGSVQNRITSVISDSLNTFKFLSAFRVPNDHASSTYTDSQLNRDGGNLIRKLHTLQNSEKDYIFDQIRDSYVELMEGVTDVDPKFDPDHHQTHLTVKVEEDPFDSFFKSEEISAGSKEILTLLTQIHLAQEDTDLLAIEEPELHLHPEAERKVLNKITDLVEEHDTQIIVATHSNVFVDEIDAGSIVRVERDGDTNLRSVDEDEVVGELADLGYSKSGLLQSEAVVFVEGLSDKLILEQWTETLGLNVDEAGISIIELEGEGNIGTHGRSLVKLLCSFEIPYLFVIDSDDNDPHDAIIELKEKINREDEDDGTTDDTVYWHTTPDHFCAWDDSDIEYFLLEAPGAIANVVGENKSTINEIVEESGADKNAGVLADIWDECYTDSHGVMSYQKDLHGKMIAKAMTEDQIPEEVSDLIEEINSLV